MPVVPTVTLFASSATVSESKGKRHGIASSDTAPYCLTQTSNRGPPGLRPGPGRQRGREEAEHPSSGRLRCLGERQRPERGGWGASPQLKLAKRSGGEASVASAASVRRLRRIEDERPMWNPFESVSTLRGANTRENEACRSPHGRGAVPLMNLVNFLPNNL